MNYFSKILFIIMKSRISQILQEIHQKRWELKNEYDKLRQKYNFEYLKWKVIFSNEAIARNKKQKKSLLNTIFTAEIRNILSAPFIYAMIIPAIILDIFLFIYQQSAFRLYNIPLVKRSDYIVYDRKHLDYLNGLEKINCLYCSYVNWLFSYAVEIGWKTEKYWCPIKHANSRVKTQHDWQEYFADYWDAEGFKKEYTNNEAYMKEDKN